MNITEYLLTPEHAKWAKERGFDGQCEAYFTKRGSLSRPTSRYPISNKSMLYSSCVAPTFDQFYDWVEEKWGIEIEIGKSKSQIDKKAYRIIGADGFTIANEYRFPTKRAARIAAVEAIIKYINENEL